MHAFSPRIPGAIALLVVVGGLAMQASADATVPALPALPVVPSAPVPGASSPAKANVAVPMVVPAAVAATTVSTPPLSGGGLLPPPNVEAKESTATPAPQVVAPLPSIASLPEIRVPTSNAATAVPAALPAAETPKTEDAAAAPSPEKAADEKSPLKTWETTLAPSVAPRNTRFNYKRQLLPSAIYRPEYGLENRHLPRRVTRADYEGLLFGSVARNDLEATRALLNAGTNINAVNPYGETPLEMARRMGASEVASLLMARGGR